MADTVVQFRAKRESACGGCPRTIQPGDPVTWDRSTRPTVYYHLPCKAGARAPEPAPTEHGAAEREHSQAVASDALDALAVAVLARMPKAGGGVTHAELAAAVNYAVLALERSLRKSLADALEEAGERFHAVLTENGIES